MFKNLTVYRFAEPMRLMPDAIESDLARVADRHCGPTERAAVGWEHVNGGRLVHSVQGHRLLKLRLEEKMLPTSVVKREVAKRSEVIFQQTGRKVGRKEMRDMKDLVEQDLLPRAFVRESSIFVWIDQKGRWLGIDCGSQKKGELVIGAMLDSIRGMPPLQQIHTEESPATVMRNWLAQREATNGFVVDAECELIGVGEVRSTVRYSKHSLDGEDVAMHLAQGKLPSKLGVSFEDSVAFVFDANLCLKKIELIGFDESQTNSDTQEDIFDATFFAKVTTMSAAIESLLLACGGEVDLGSPEEGEPD